MNQKKTSTIQKNGYSVDDLFFPSREGMCSAWLYRPEKKTGRLPAIIMANGFAAPRDLALPLFAERFARSGYVVLVFDYRGFGKSSGQLRNLVSPSAHIEDYICALDFLASLEFIDSERIALWGVSFSGGHSLCAAAEDERVRCLLGLVPFTDAMATASRISPAMMATGITAGLADVAMSLAGRSFEIAVTGHPGEVAMLTWPGWHERIKETMPTDWLNRMPARAVFEISTYRPINRAGRVKCPVQFIYGSRDQGIPAASVEKTARQLKSVELVKWDVGHLEPLQEPLLNKTTAVQLDFLKRSMA